MSTKMDILFKDINKQFKEEIAFRGLAKYEDTGKIPFTSPKMNYLTYGGLPRKRIIEFFGEEGGGKTTTALDVVKNAQIVFENEYNEQLTKLQAIEKPTKDQQEKLNALKSRGPKSILYVDCENTLDSDWASKLGVNVESILLIQPKSQYAEQIFEIVLQAMETGEVGLVVIDSLGVMVSSQAFEKSLEEKTYGGIASSLTLFSKKAEMLCVKHDVIVIGINQMRENLNSPYSKGITTGGKAWKHNCTVRIQFQKGSYVDDGGSEIKRSSESPSGNIVDVSIEKTKSFKPDRCRGRYTLNYDRGIDVVVDTADLAEKLGLIVKGGSWFTFVDTNGEVVCDENGEELKFQGRPSLLEYLDSNEVFFEDLKKDVESMMY